LIRKQSKPVADQWILADCRVWSKQTAGCRQSGIERRGEHNAVAGNWNTNSPRNIKLKFMLNGYVFMALAKLRLNLMNLF